MLDRLLGLCGVAVALGALGWALAGGPSAPVVTVAVIGLVLAAADALVWRATGSGDGPAGPDLSVPEGRRVAAPPWALLVGAAAALGCGAALVVGAPVAAAVTGSALAIPLAGVLRKPSEEQLPTRIVSTAQRLRRFARRHGVGRGDPVGGYVTAVGESGARLFVVAPDGAWADVMLPDGDVSAIAELARIDLRDPTDPAAARRMRIDRGLWDQMTRSW